MYTLHINITQKRKNYVYLLYLFFYISLIVIPNNSFLFTSLTYHVPSPLRHFKTFPPNLYCLFYLNDRVKELQSFRVACY